MRDGIYHQHHHDSFYFSSEPWRAVEDRISSDYTALTPLKEDRFPGSFLHIFSTVYAAGHYSYKWAEVSKFSVIRFPSVSFGHRARPSVIATIVSITRIDTSKEKKTER